VPGRIEKEEAARALEGWVAGGAVVRRGGDVWAWEQGGDGEGRGRGVGLGGGVSLSLVSVSCWFYGPAGRGIVMGQWR
jgi:hypothetical protein